MCAGRGTSARGGGGLGNSGIALPSFRWWCGGGGRGCSRGESSPPLRRHADVVELRARGRVALVAQQCQEVRHGQRLDVDAHHSTFSVSVSASGSSSGSSGNSGSGPATSGGSGQTCAAYHSSRSVTASGVCSSTKV